MPFWTMVVPAVGLTDDSKTASTPGKKNAQAGTGAGALTAAAGFPAGKPRIGDTVTIAGMAAVSNAGMLFENKIASTAKDGLLAIGI